MLRLVAGSEEGAPIHGPVSHCIPHVDILIPVHNEWHALRPCLDAIEAFASYANARITLLDDGSDPFVRKRIEAFVGAPGPYSKCTLRNDQAIGFTKSVNRGIDNSSGEFILLLASNTLVSPGFLENLVNAASGDERIACVTPMTNPRALHSVDIPMGWNIFQYAASLRAIMTRSGFDAVTAEGFCMLLRREALADIGPYDEAFAMGAGAEIDWCMRARKRGRKVLGVENTFVYHQARADARNAEDKCAEGARHPLFLERWAQAYDDAMAHHAELDPLQSVRRAYVHMERPTPPPVISALADRLRAGGAAYAATEAIRYFRNQGGARRVLTLWRSRGLTRKNTRRHPMPMGFHSTERPRVIYVLEKFSRAGGVLSVVQLVNRLTLLGWDAKIATHHDHNQEHLDAYTLYHKPYVFPSVQALIENFPETDIAVATLWSTAEKVRRVVQKSLRPVVPWYFLQDDETRFFHGLDTAGPDRVLASYDLIPNKIVKSDWLRDVLLERGHPTHKISLGMDLDIFYPETSPRNRPMRIVAMARPETPRRGFTALVETLREVKRQRPSTEIALFGCNDLARHTLDFEYTDLGFVANERLRRVYCESTIFLDLSEFQGFGRTGLEAMACGCASVLTKFGGINEYASAGQNCLSVDPKDLAQCVSSTLRLLDDPHLREKLAQRGLETVQQYSCDREAQATSRLFAASLGIEADVSVGALKKGSFRPCDSPMASFAPAQ